jgi:hypothetical protein
MRPEEKPAARQKHGHYVKLRGFVGAAHVLQNGRIQNIRKSARSGPSMCVLANPHPVA